jgi:hypothetical protein
MRMRVRAGVRIIRVIRKHLTRMCAAAALDDACQYLYFCASKASNGGCVTLLARVSAKTRAR